MRIWMERVCLLGLLLWASPGEAQDYPNRPIKFVVPFPAGGPADTISRILTDKMASLIGQTMRIIDRWWQRRTAFAHPHRSRNGTRR